ncbi:hypothetical protein F5B20DRAFT_558202 [Whalleya microplaca]|nr:hypothetical protein F5B20DRAFT_558202 [Whalleya microplaca]
MTRDSQDVFKRAELRLSQPSSQISIRTMPELVDYNAIVNPTALFCLQAIKAANGVNGDSDVGGAVPGTIPMTMSQLRDAIVRCQADLYGLLPDIKSPVIEQDGSITKNKVVALFLDSDVGLLIHLFALLGLGVPVILLSIRLSSVAVRHLLDKVGAGTMIVSPRLTNMVKSVSEASSELRTYTAQSFRDYMTGDMVPEGATICKRGHFCADEDRNVIILHSSGTTGLPKPIPQPHKYLLGYATCHTDTEAEDVGALNMSTLPLYHGFGMLAPSLALHIGKPFWLPPAHTIPTGSSTVAALRALPAAKSLLTVPHILQEIITLPPSEWVEVLRPLQFIACGGGPLKVSVGEALASRGIKILAHFGATEIGALAPIFVPGPEYDWHYWRLRQDFDIRVEAVQEDENENARTDDATTTKHKFFQLVARPFGWSEDFVLQDWLVTRDGEMARRDFRAMGRKDDLIVLATGEKVLPRILESMLEESPLVKSAIAFGEEQFELGVLVEPVAPLDDVEKFRDEIWPIILKAGEQMDSHARISNKSGIVVTTPDQTIPRSDKGSVLRKEVYRQFSAQIQAAYELIEASAGDDSSLTLTTSESLEEGLKTLVQLVLGDNVESDKWTIEDDLFELGLNSLQCVRVQRALQNAVKQAAEKGVLPSQSLPRDFVYKHPTVASMTASLRSGGNGELAAEKTISEYIEEYRLSTRQGDVVLLTGSTGSLGSHLLAHLVSLPGVEQVICLRRSAASDRVNGTKGNPVTEQVNNATSKGARLSSDNLGKISVLYVEPFKPRLGLSDTDYTKLSRSVTHILHAAWPVDFKRALSSFQTQFLFLQNLLQLARDAHASRPSLKPRLGFLSSIAAVGQYPHTRPGERIVPERMMDGDTSIKRFSYGQAKLICEGIVARAAVELESELEACTMRVGQVAGARESGFWNPKEHFPALVQVAQATGKWPQLQGTLSWLPVDTCAAAICDILLATPAPDLVYHVENPVRQDWPSMLGQIAAELGFEREAFVSFDEWRRLAVAAATDHVDLLMEFFAEHFLHMATGGVILDTARARQASETLRCAGPVETEVVKSYVREWKRIGLLKSTPVNGVGTKVLN